MTELEYRPLYARVLRLRHLRPSGLLCFCYFEGMIALGVVLALAELVSWWAVPALPVAVAAMVKLNDLIAGALPGASRPAGARPAGRVAVTAVDDAAAEDLPGVRPPGQGEPTGSPPVRAVRQVSRDLSDTLDPVDSPRQRFRQSARRRYE